MASDSVYRIVDVVGVSEKSWEDAGRNAVETAAGSLRDLRVAEVTKMDMRVEKGKVTAFRTRVAIVADSGQLPACCARRERPRCHTAEQRDELAAADHSITSSARASSVGGTSRPSALAVLRLITSS